MKNTAKIEFKMCAKCAHLVRLNCDLCVSCLNSVENVEYSASVRTLAGWRAVVMTAQAQRISAKRVRIVAVTKIDGVTVTRNMTRTGSARQAFNGAYFAGVECGKIKNIKAN